MQASEEKNDLLVSPIRVLDILSADVCWFLPAVPLVSHASQDCCQPLVFIALPIFNTTCNYDPNVTLPMPSYVLPTLAYSVDPGFKILHLSCHSILASGIINSRKA